MIEDRERKDRETSDLRQSAVEKTSTKEVGESFLRINMLKVSTLGPLREDNLSHKAEPLGSFTLKRVNL